MVHVTFRYGSRVYSNITYTVYEICSWYDLDLTFSLLLIFKPTGIYPGHGWGPSSDLEALKRHHWGENPPGELQTLRRFSTLLFTRKKQTKVKVEQFCLKPSSVQHQTGPGGSLYGRLEDEGLSDSSLAVRGSIRRRWWSISTSAGPHAMADGHCSVSEDTGAKTCSNSPRPSRHECVWVGSRFTGRSDLKFTDNEVNQKRKNNEHFHSWEEWRQTAASSTKPQGPPATQAAQPRHCGGDRRLWDSDSSAQFKMQQVVLKSSAAQSVTVCLGSLAKHTHRQNTLMCSVVLTPSAAVSWWDLVHLLRNTSILPRRYHGKHTNKTKTPRRFF